MDTSGRRFSGSLVATAIANMHDRGNGLGGGFAGYGLYPNFKDSYCFHIMFLSKETRHEVEDFLRRHFRVHHGEEIPTRRGARVSNPPIIWRYFVDVAPAQDGLGSATEPIVEADYIVERVMQINTGISDAFVFSSGKDMGVFKGVGFPEDVADYFRIEDYAGYAWTAHGRFPTNTTGWWGGAHPFSVLDWTVVHNGEISSYGINRRYLEMHGYICTMQTDTEVVAYAADLLMRRHQLPVELAAKVMAPPFWEVIDRMPEDQREVALALRQVYGSLLLNGPFTVIICRSGEMIGLTDRIRLRPLTAATSGDVLFLSSEEAAIRLVCPDLDRTWIPMGGEPIIGRLKTSAPVVSPASRNGIPVLTGEEQR
ncbi:MAG: glutamine amidotransferase family protein [Chloroflexi bacterium]|nr:glutamine amidotransferase family protein [Chloroflexota bacterium]